MNQHPTESNEPDGNTCQSHAPSFAKVLHGRKHRAALPLTRTLRTIRQQLVAADGSRRILFAATMAPTDGRVAQAVRACGKANPEGWKMVAGGRSGERGNDHRETASDDRAPRRGARPSLHMVEPDLIEQTPHDRVWHPSGVQDIFRAVTRRSPGAGERRPPATLCQPFGLNSPECPSSTARCP